jgi:hypothetical protein
MKRISCRVVGSAPLARGSNASLRSNHSNKRRRRIGDIVAVNVQAIPRNNSVTYTSRLGIAKVSVDNGLAGQILDCYV